MPEKRDPRSRQYLPRLVRRALELKALGIESISTISADFPLTSKQAIIRDATASGRPYGAPVPVFFPGMTLGSILGHTEGALAVQPARREVQDTATSGGSR